MATKLTHKQIERILYLQLLGIPAIHQRGDKGLQDLRLVTISGGLTSLTDYGRKVQFDIILKSV